MMSLQSVMLLLSFLFCCSAQAPTTTLEGKLLYADKSPFNETTRITLNNAEYTTYSREDGSFSIFDVPPGIHQLDVHSVSYHFGQIKIQLLPDSMDTPKCLEYPYPGAAKMATKYPLELSPQATLEYFEKPKGFNIFGLLKNPMIIMVLFSGVMMYLMPKMMDDLTPEEQEKMRQHMKNQQDPTQMLSSMFGGGGDSSKEDAVAARQARRRAKKD
eukprot:Nitzschia sp. Nitz4//scaffold20_size174350//93122//93873//NITZ4_002106-RA/size174350-snap-gene-0.218-mRNA-1//1//CDS//3329541821//5748//frame0